jgi:Ca2+-binding RTX toxin-like protein
VVDDPNTPEDESQDAVPAEDVTIIQVWVNGAPVLVPGVDPLTTQEALDALTTDKIKFIEIYAGAGDDVVNATAYNKNSKITIKTRQYGEAGNDILIATDNGDLLDGGAGNDGLFGGLGNDSLSGGAGDDILDGEGFLVIEDGKALGGDDTLIGGGGRNVIRGGPGNDKLYATGEYDVLDYSTSITGVNVDLTAAAGPDPGKAADGFGTTDDVYTGFMVLRGSRFDDTLKGYRSIPMTILGGRGNDTIWGSTTGGDILYGEAGADTIFGDPPDTDPTQPTPDEHGGADLIIGGAGGDTIYGGPGGDEIYGDGDLVPQNFDEDTTLADYFPDDQMIQLKTHPLNAVVPGAISELCIIIDTPTLTQDGILDISACLTNYLDLPGVPGTVTVVGNAFALPCSEYVSFPPYLVGDGILVPAYPPGVGAGVGGDTIYGGGGADLIAGGGGADTIYGGSDRQSQNLGAASPDPQPPFNLLGDDNVDTGDLIYGDFVCNRLRSLQQLGSWIDIGLPLALPPEPAPPDLANFMPPPNSPTVEDLARTGYGGDSIRGGPGLDVILGCGGNDRINGNEDSDVIYGDFFFGAGDDVTYNLIGTTSTTPFGLVLASGSDIIRGNEDSDFLFGGPGSDVLIGGDAYDGEVIGDYTPESYGDVLQGNAGSDILIGCDLYGLGRITDDSVDRGFGSYGLPGTDTGPSDTIDYSMVPPAALGGTGVVVDLGDNVPGGEPTAGRATNDGEGSTDTIYAIENVVGSRHADTIMGTRRSDDSLLSGRASNTAVVDAFGRDRFPSYYNHPSGFFYYRSMVGRLQPDGTTETGYDNILLGEDGDDILIGRDGCDALAGGNGNDKIWGDGQSLNGLTPPDVLNPDDPARSGSDEIWGDVGNDELYGEWGNDVLHGGAGSDYMDGGNGTNLLAYTEDDEVGSLAINLSQATIDLTDWGTLATKYAKYDWPLNPIGTTVPPGGFPATTVTIPDDTKPGSVTTITFPGGNKLPGFDYDPRDVSNHRGLSTAFCNGYYDVLVNRVPDPTQVAPGAVINPSRFQYVYGSAGPDVIYGHGTAGTIIYGSSGSDILVGGKGNDQLYGDLDNDILEGGGGDDLLVGGDPLPTPPGPQFDSPKDWVSYYHATSGVVVDLNKTGPQDTTVVGKDTIQEIQNVLGSKFNDVITGNGRINTLLGDAGDDVLAGRADGDIFANNRTYITSDTLDGGAGNDVADYRVGDPVAIAASAAAVEFLPCPAPYATDTCGVMQNDGEGGSDDLVNIESIREPDNNLLLSGLSTRTIAPDQSVKLEFTVTGGDGKYSASFDPTTGFKDVYGTDGKTKTGTKEVAILAAPADQNNPVSPFTPDEDMPPYKAVQTVTGNPGGNGVWKFVVYARPLATTSFRVTVTDMTNISAGLNGPAAKQISRLVKVVVAAEMVVSIEQSEYVITAGNSVQLRGRVVGGTPPYQITWTAEDGSQASTLSATNIFLPVAKPSVTTRYTMTVRDTTPDSLSQTGSATTKVTVLPKPTTPAGSNVPSGTNTGTQSGSQNTNNQTPNTTPTETTGTPESESTPVAPAPMCGFGVTSWMVVGNLLVLALMKRKRL